MPSDNPFHFGTPVPVDEGAFTGRTNEISTLCALMRSHVSAVLLSPRRYGKTSILLRAEKQMTQDRPAVVRTNAYRSNTAARFATALISETYKLPGTKWRRSRKASDFLQRLRVRPVATIGDDGRPQFSFESSLETRDLTAVMEDTFAMLAELAVARPTVLVVDEFQAVVDLDGQLPATIKGLLDAHPKVSLVAAGSKRHLMEELFVNRNTPHYYMAEKINVGPIPDDEMMKFLIRRAASADKSFAHEAAQFVIALAGPVPDDIQHLAWAAFEDAGRSDAVRVGNVEAAMQGTIDRRAQLYDDLLNHLPSAQRLVVAQLAIAPTSQPTGAEFVRRTGLANGSSVNKALTGLTEAQLVDQRGGITFVADSFWAAWLRERAAI